MGAPCVILGWRAANWAALALRYRAEAAGAKGEVARENLLHAAAGCDSIIRKIVEVGE